MKKKMQTKFGLNLTFEKVTIVRSNIDHILFALAKTNHFDTTLPYANLHEEYEEYNDRSLKINTPKGNGPNLVRKMGWPGEIEIIDTKTGNKTIIDSWVF